MKNASHHLLHHRSKATLAPRTMKKLRPGNFWTVGPSWALSFAVTKQDEHSNRPPGLPASQKADPSSTWAVEISMNSAPKSLKPSDCWWQFWEAQVYDTPSKLLNSEWAHQFRGHNFRKTGDESLITKVS